ncbi:MAG: hypothetical protein LBI99_03030 [Propionibacteriaceae bacterium]|jgi:surface-anchored protein|nr:hypothetical protein [Propionibacteriaceae bacterium]
MSLNIKERGALKTNRLSLARRGVMALTALCAAAALALSGTATANAAWPNPDVPAGEYDIIALDSGWELMSYAHDNEEWYDSSDKVFEVTNGRIPPDEEEDYATSGGGIRNAADINAFITIYVAAAPAGGSITIGSGSPSWTVDINNWDSNWVEANSHEHFEWTFSEPGDYKIVVTAENGLTFAYQTYLFTVS